MLKFTHLFHLRTNKRVVCDMKIVEKLKIQLQCHYSNANLFVVLFVWHWIFFVLFMCYCKTYYSYLRFSLEMCKAKSKNVCKINQFNTFKQKKKTWNSMSCVDFSCVFFIFFEMDFRCMPLLLNWNDAWRKPISYLWTKQHIIQ